MGFACGEGIRTGVREREVHLRRLGSTEVAVRACFLDFIKGVAEHLVVRFLAVKKEIYRFPDLLILYLSVEVLVDNLGTLFRGDI